MKLFLTLTLTLILTLPRCASMNGFHEARSRELHGILPYPKCGYYCYFVDGLYLVEPFYNSTQDRFHFEVIHYE